jgi:WD40 repeat protein
LNLDRADLASQQHRSRWDAHRNAIFDLHWYDKDTKIATGTGDRVCRIFDVSTP